MRSLLCLPLIALLILGCDDSSDKMTAPVPGLPTDGEPMDLDKMADNALAQMPAAACVQLRYISETGAVHTTNRGNCSCLSGRPFSVSAMIWNGAPLNNVIGKAYCTTSGIFGRIFLLGTAKAVDPGPVRGIPVAFGVVSFVGNQHWLSGTSPVLSCTLSSTVTNVLNRSNRLVICVFH